MTLLVVIVILALIFDYINGFHDAANSIATIVSTKVLTPFQAVVWAAFFNFVAYFIFQDHAVANTIGKSVHAEYITLPVILAGLLAAIFWNLITWWYGIPSSSSHTLIGGFAGAAITHAVATKGFAPLGSIVELKKITEIILFIFLAPIIGMVIAIFITVVTVIFASLKSLSSSGGGADGSPSEVTMTCFCPARSFVISSRTISSGVVKLGMSPTTMDFAAPFARPLSPTICMGKPHP